MLVVIKKDNSTEDFHPEKIVSAIEKAAFRCDKKIPAETMNEIAQ